MDRVISFPSVDIGGNEEFIVSSGAQNIGETKRFTFVNEIVSLGTTQVPQLRNGGTGNFFNIHVPTNPTVTRNIDTLDVGADGCFAITQERSTLNWYEELTIFTSIEIIFGGEATDITYSTKRERMTRIERQVYVKGVIALSNKEISTDQVRIVTGVSYVHFNLGTGNFESTFQILS